MPGGNPHEGPAHPAADGPVLSVVVPMFDEQEVLPLFARRLRPVLDGMDLRYEVVAVDDGSRDATWAILLALRTRWPELRLVRLRANAGHMAALGAGLAASRGDYVASLDADLQDPPEVVPKMLALARAEGLDVVYGVRRDRSSDGPLKRATAAVYYRLMRRLAGPTVPHQAGAFRLMSRAPVDVLTALPPHSRVYRLVVPALGFPSAEIGYVREARAAGTSKYPFRRMVSLALDSITGFSIAPLRLAAALGFLGVLAAIAGLVFSLAAYASGRVVPGWASLFTTVLLFSGVQLLCLGLLGEYVGRIHRVLRQMPPYTVAEDTGVPGAATDVGRPPAVVAPSRPGVAPLAAVSRPD